MIHIFLMICHRKFHVFHKAFLVGHVINQGRKIYSGRHACLNHSQKIITKCNGLLLQIATPFLLQSATRFIRNCNRYYKVRWIYYKLRQVLQSAMIITNCDSTRYVYMKIQSNNRSALKSHRTIKLCHNSTEQIY